MELRGRHWLSRGQPHCYESLEPSIDRDPFKGLKRTEKLHCERRSINLFRSTAHFFASPAEEKALVDDIIALMVLRHHGVPSRLLDWSLSPYVAAYFAACSDEADGELWSFSFRDYVKKGKRQWRDHPETTTDGSGHPDKFAAGLTAFRVDEPPNWVIAAFYSEGFPRQNAQRGAYTMTSRFDIDHAEALAELLVDPALYQRYVLGANLKKALRARLREQHGIWRGSLFPDSAGAAETARVAFGLGEDSGRSV
jgi:hypothetical protein